ncbi:MAG: FtsX-like permease family protein [Arenicella sp.]|nr:FtsX-like permease family protein [Arenicella sp.]
MSPLTLPFITLLRRPVRSGLTVLGIAVAVAGIISIQGLVNGLEKAWIGGIENRGTSIIGVRKGAVELLGATFPAEIIEEFDSFNNLAAVAGELVRLVDIDPSLGFESQMTILYGWDPEQYLWQELEFSERANRILETDVEFVFLGPAKADQLGLSVGGDLVIQDRTFPVAGIFIPKGVMMSNAIIMPLSTLQETTGLEGKINFLNLRLRAGIDEVLARDLIVELSSKFKDLRFTETGRLADTVSFFEIWKALSWGASIIVLGMGIVITLNTLLMSVTERTWEIGVLSSIGWGDGRIFRLIMTEGMIITLVGGIAGILIGMVGLIALAGIPLMAGFLSPDFSVLEIFKIILFILVMGFISSYYPAYRAIRIQPAEALRHH